MAARTRKKRCANCGEPLDPARRKDAGYCDSSCRARGSEKRKSRRRGKVRYGNAQKRSRAAQTRRKPELRISYLKAVDVVATYLVEEDRSHGPLTLKRVYADATAASILKPLLTDRQRAALNETGHGALVDVSTDGATRTRAA